ncbi:hypothetical protein YC2023_024520 [Brassica napus]
MCVPLRCSSTSSGDELRENFVNQLVRALRKGSRFQNLKIALAIFSKRYCEFEWCLDELAMMYKQMNEGKLVVISIFYNETANDVKRACNPGRVAEVNGEEKEFTTLFKKMKEKHANDPQKRGCPEVCHRKNRPIYRCIRVRRHLGMPLKKPMSNVEVALTALWTSSVFSFIIAPMLFPNVKFFTTGKWVVGFPFLVLVYHIWNSENKKIKLAYISQLSHITIWDEKENHNKQPGPHQAFEKCKRCRHTA